MAKSKKRLTRTYRVPGKRGQYVGPKTPWEDVPDSIKEHEDFLNKRMGIVSRDDPGRDREAEAKIKAKADRIREDQATREAEVLVEEEAKVESD